MKSFSTKTRITFATSILVIIGFAILVGASLKSLRVNVTDTLVNQFVKEVTQISRQAGIIMESGGSVDELQTFVNDCTANNSYIAYAVVVDNTVTAVAHSDEEKIGKSYADDTGYSVPAATKGEIMTSLFWADVQGTWTYDVMCPIYVNGELYGSMDVGVFSSEVDNLIKRVSILQTSIAVVMTAVICIIIAMICTSELRPVNTLVGLCDEMGKGNFNDRVPAKMLNKKGEIGKMAVAIDNMQEDLRNLIGSTRQTTEQLFGIADSLNEGAITTRSKSEEIVNQSEMAAGRSEKQSELTNSNEAMTREIANGMEEISQNIQNVTIAAEETATEAERGAGNIDVVVEQMSVIANNVSSTYEQIQNLEKMSGDIENVVKLIADIASQTNLLALNASIEAARAGEQGKGFAVVAGEVGSLADQSRDAAADIGKIIQDIQNSIASCVTLMKVGNDSVKEGLQLADTAKMSFSEIARRINHVSEEMTSVSAVTEEVTSSTVTLHETITDIAGLADSVSSDTRSVSVTANAQVDMMKDVLEEVSGMRNLSRELKERLQSFEI